GLPPRPPPLPPPVDRRSHRTRPQGQRYVHTFRLPAMVALRCAARPRLPAQRRRPARRAHRRGDRPGRVQARLRRPLAARDPAPGQAGGGERGWRGPAEPLDHAAGDASDGVVWDRFVRPKMISWASLAKVDALINTHPKVYILMGSG